MSDPIKVGDLVLVVKPTPCCGNMEALGGPFDVTKVGRPNVDHCRFCFRGRNGQLGAYLVSSRSSGWIETYRLKRIPPLSELEGANEKEDLREPS